MNLLLIFGHQPAGSLSSSPLYQLGEWIDPSTTNKGVHSANGNPKRLSSEERRKLIYHFEELEASGKKVSYYAVYQWTRTDIGQKLFTQPPCRRAVQNLIGKWLELNRDTELAIKDRPRNQEGRSGKRAPLPPMVKKSIIEMAEDKDQPKHKRRSIELAKEFQVSNSSVKRVLRGSGKKYFRPCKTIALKPHHRQFRVRWAKKWRNEPKTFWRKFLFSDEKIFRAIPKAHAQNDGLWLTATNTPVAEMEQVEVVNDRHCASVAMWGAVSWHSKAKPVVFTGILDGDFYRKTIVKESVIH